MSENYNLQPDTNSQTVRNADSYNLDTSEHMDNGVSVHMCPNGHSKNLARHSKASQVFSDGFSDGENGISEQDTRECGECRYFNECPCGECLWGVCINTYSRDYGEYVSTGASACDYYRGLYE